MFLFLLILSLAPEPAFGHSAPIPTPVAPYHVQGNTLRDARGERFLLQGASIAVESEIPVLTFRILRQRWNMNAVRLVITPEFDLELADRLARSANAEGLVVILACKGGGDENFWARTAERFRDNSMLILSLGQREVVEEDRWTAWRTRTESLIAAIRSAGARQIIAIGAHPDTLEFREFPLSAIPEDGNLLFEVQPYFASAATDAQRDAKFGELIGRAPVYASEWGMAADRDCAAITDADGVPVYLFMIYTLVKGMSWTIPIEQLSADRETLEPAFLSNAQGCGPGGILLLWLTGDTYGFGSIAPDFIANAAGGPASSLIPGQILSIYGQGLGPEIEANAQPDERGMLPTSLADVEVRMDGIPIPVISAGSFTLRVQVPYEVEGKTRAEIQAWYREVASNKVSLAVANTGPEIFTRAGSIADAEAWHEDGEPVSQTRPASSGMVVMFQVTGCGSLQPAAPTGRVAPAQGSRVAASLQVSIDGESAEVLEATETAGRAGVVSIRARVPNVRTTSPRTVPLTVTVGGVRNKASVQLWVR